MGKLFPYASQEQSNKAEPISNIVSSHTSNNTTNTLNNFSVSTENLITQKPKIKFQLDLSSLLDD
jgi:hypothetical protein